MPTYAADLVVRVRNPRHLPHVFNGFKNQAVQIDSDARVTQSRDLIILVSLVVDEMSAISHVADMVRQYEPFLDQIELHVLTPSRDEMLRTQQNMGRSVSELGLSNETSRLLGRGGIFTVRDLTNTTKRRLRHVEGIGPVKIQEIEDALILEGLSLSDT